MGSLGVYGNFSPLFSGLDGNNMESLVEKIKEFLENEAHSCSMDFGCVTPEYVYRMWGGTVTLSDIEVALNVCKKELLYER